MNCRCSSRYYLAFSLSIMVLWLVSHYRNKVGEVFLTGEPWAYCQSSLLRSVLGVSGQGQQHTFFLWDEGGKLRPHCSLKSKMKQSQEDWWGVLVYSVIGANCGLHLRSLRLVLHLEWITDATCHVLSNLKRKQLTKPAVYLPPLRGCLLFQT